MFCVFVFFFKVEIRIFRVGVYVELDIVVLFKENNYVFFFLICFLKYKLVFFLYVFYF